MTRPAPTGRQVEQHPASFGDICRRQVLTAKVVLLTASVELTERQVSGQLPAYVEPDDTGIMTTAPPLGTLRHRNRVPYIARWSSEQTIPALVVDRGAGIGYADEHPYDRDARGVLWRRVSVSPGKGRPEYGRVHLLRQRRAMRRLLCQVCGRPVTVSPDGLLWLMGRQGYDANPWPAPIETGHPPVCLACAQISVRACPHLRRAYVALRVRGYRPIGVHGVLYRPSRPFPVVDQVAAVGFSDYRIRWMQAAQIMISLDDYEVIDLASLTDEAFSTTAR